MTASPLLSRRGAVAAAGPGQSSSVGWWWLEIDTRLKALISTIVH